MLVRAGRISDRDDIVDVAGELGALIVTELATVRRRSLRALKVTLADWDWEELANSVAQVEVLTSTAPVAPTRHSPWWELSDHLARVFAADVEAECWTSRGTAVAPTPDDWTHDRVLVQVEGSRSILVTQPEAIEPTLAHPGPVPAGAPLLEVLAAPGTVLWAPRGCGVVALPADGECAYVRFAVRRTRLAALAGLGPAVEGVDPAARLATPYDVDRMLASTSPSWLTAFLEHYHLDANALRRGAHRARARVRPASSGPADVAIPPTRTGFRLAAPGGIFAVATPGAAGQGRTLAMAGLTVRLENRSLGDFIPLIAGSDSGPVTPQQEQLVTSLDRLGLLLRCSSREVECS